MNPSRLMVDRLARFVATGPTALPTGDTLFLPSAATTSTVIWPLVARRNLKRFTAVAVRFAAQADPPTRQTFDAVLTVLAALDDGALTDLLTRPEITSWIAGAEAASADEAATFGGWLVQFVLPVVIRQGGDWPSLPIATSSPGHLELLGLGRRLRLDAAAPIAACSVNAGVPSVDGTPAPPDDPRWVPIPLLADRIAVSGGPNGWLDHAFPERDQVADCDDLRLRAFADRLAAGAAELDAVWPEAWLEVQAMLRWVVPITVDDSFYVPGFRGLVAIGEHDPYPMACNLFHETSHNKLSSILELASASTNPDELVFSPFAHGKGPVTSLLHSCWSFAREYLLIGRLKAHGTLGEIDRLELKFRVFFDKGLPSLRRGARLTTLGDAVVTTIEEAVR